MRKRHKVSKSGSRKLFTATAQKVHRKNVLKHVARGGIRL